MRYGEFWCDSQSGSCNLYRSRSQYLQSHRFHSSILTAQQITDRRTLPECVQFRRFPSTKRDGLRNVPLQFPDEKLFLVSINYLSLMAHIAPLQLPLLQIFPRLFRAPVSATIHVCSDKMTQHDLALPSETIRILILNGFSTLQYLLVRHQNRWLRRHFSLRQTRKRFSNENYSISILESN